MEFAYANSFSFLAISIWVSRYSRTLWYLTLLILYALSIISTTNNTNEIVQGLFELKFLLIFTKCTNLCNQVTLFLKNDYPIILTYQIASLGEIKLVLSPSKSD